ncbi:MAG: hypothetical protein HY820_01215 [Acidobacteria bacterium]|nr:hypothetical protein [Acidobacteriota bacterium]
MSKPNPFTFRDFNLPLARRQDPGYIAAALGRFVPSGKLSEEWTQEVVKLLRIYQVRGGVIFQVLEKARQAGHEFPPLFGELAAEMMMDPEWEAWVWKKATERPLPNGHTSFGPPPDNATFERGAKMEIRRLEQKFREAEDNHDVKTMSDIWEAVAALILEGIRRYGQAQQMRRRVNDKITEWDEFNAAIDAMLAEAPTLRSHFRTITPNELTQMRRMPRPSLPSGVRIRMQNQPARARRPTRGK